MDPSFKPDYRILYRGIIDGITDCTDSYCVSDGKSLEFIHTQEQYENAVTAYSDGLYQTQDIDFQNNFVLLYDAGNYQWPVKVLSIDYQGRAIIINLEIHSGCYYGTVSLDDELSAGVVVPASVSIASTSSASVATRERSYVLIEINRFNPDADEDGFVYIPPKLFLINETIGECG